MAISIRDPATDAAIRRLAALTGESLTDAIRHAVEAEYSRRKAAVPLAERIAPLQDRFAALPRTGAPADKAFFDDLSGED